MKALTSLVVGLVVLAGCGGGDGETQTVTVTVERTVALPPATTTVQVVPAPETNKVTTEAAAADRDIAVPDVVGMDRQLAHKTIQAAGLYNLDEVDATGDDRMLLFDRNWTVVEQVPPAGTTADTRARILLRLKEDG